MKAVDAAVDTLKTKHFILSWFGESCFFFGEWRFVDFSFMDVCSATDMGMAGSWRAGHYEPRQTSARDCRDPVLTGHELLGRRVQLARSPSLAGVLWTTGGGHPP